MRSRRREKELDATRTIRSDPDCRRRDGGRSAECRLRPVQSSAGACESNETVIAAADEDLVCRNEPLTGSHIIERRCYRRRDIEARRARDIAVMERLIIQANRPIRNPAAGTPNPH
jgi:hypothetical protein